MITALLVCLLAFGQAQEPPGYRIAGTVVNAVTRRPVSGARVTVTPEGQPGQPLIFITGADGRFMFPDIPPGKYELVGQRRGLLPHGCDAHPGMASPIVAGPDQHTDSIVFPLCPPGSVAGTVVDDAGEPVEKAAVQLFSSSIVNGRRRLTTLRVRLTADTGDFRFASLPPGTYYLAVSGSPWYTKFAETQGDAAPRSMTHVGYRTQYYSNTSDAASAAPLILQPGQEVTANFALLPVAAAAVHVHVTGEEDLSKRFTLTLAGVQGVPVVIREGTESGDLYNFWGVTPGHYTLRVNALDAGRAWYATKEFEVGETDIDVSTTLLQAPSLSGTLEVDGGGNPPANLSVILIDTESNDSRTLPRGIGGKFSMSAISPQCFRLALSGDDDYYLKRWSVEGAQREGETLDLRQSSTVRLKLVVAKGTGRVKGTVHHDGEPLPAAMVIMASATSAQTAIPRVALTASDGSYDFRGVPPGSYAVFAIKDGADLEYASPAAIEPYLKSAQQIQVTPREVATRDIPKTN